MARYVKSVNLLPYGHFIGWDELTPNAESSEATNVHHLYKLMGEQDFKIFKALTPGEFKTVDDTEYFREW